MKKDTWFLIISFSVLSAVVGGYVGTMLSNNSRELAVRTAHRLLGISAPKRDTFSFGASKKDANALATDFMNNVRAQAKQDLRLAPEGQIAVNDTLNSKKPQESKQLNTHYENAAKQNPLKPKQAMANHVSYSTAGHSKANGLNMTIEYPEKWTAKEGKRPHIVQVFNDGKLSGCTIESQPMGKFLSVKQWEREFNRYSKEDMETFGEVLFIHHTKYDGAPGVLVESAINKQRAGMNLHMHYLAHMFGHKDNLVTVLCISGGTTQEMADDIFKQDVLEFMQIGNSIILTDKWEPVTIENDTDSFIDKLSELLHWTPEQNAADYDSGKSIYKQQVLDKMTDALSYANQPEEIQSAEVDGVSYSLTKSDKGHIVQITTEIPDADLTAFMDVFTKMVDVEKLKKFYENNNQKTLEQAVGAYNFIENANMRAAKWCEPYYSLKVLPGKMRAKFASR